jgi:hypothetical protein
MACSCWQLGCASSQTADGDDDAARSQRCSQWDVSGSAHRYNGRCSLHAGGRHALGSAPFDLFHADLGERRSNGRPSAVRLKRTV